jgi:hypothetical protein
MQSHPNFGLPTHVAQLRGVTVEFNGEQHDAALAWLVATAGGYDTSMTVKTLVVDATPKSIDAAPSDDPDDTQFNRAVRTARLEDDAAKATAAGFVLQDPLYAIGRKVNATGVENAKAARLAYDAKPLVADAATAFVAKITTERRKDSTVLVRDISMAGDGQLVVQDCGKGRVSIGMGEAAFDSLLSRTGIGGAGYLKSCWPELRAQNVNAWTQRILDREVGATNAWNDGGRKGAEPKAASAVLRCRSTVDSKRAVYAVVSPQYRSMDCDVIAKAISEAAPSGSRGSIVYDGQQARFEVLFHSDVAAEDFGCGEIFRAGVIVRSNDVGDGSIRVSAMVERNLCLNLIILDTAEQQVAGIRHVGNELAKKFESAFATALDKIKSFRDAWGYARQDSVVAATIMASGEDLSGMTAREVLAGIAWSQMHRELVPVRGRKPEVLKAVLMAYDREPAKTSGLVRSDVVNAWTRYAHESAAQSDPWIEDEIQSAAGRMLQTHKPLPYEKVPFAF